MTEVADEIRTYVNSTFRSGWTYEDWDRVPTEDDKLGLGNHGVRINAAVLYADLTDSTGLVKNEGQDFAAEVYKAYVYAAAKVIRANEGSVTAYDGDRVMGVFIGDQMRNNAVNAAARLSAIVDKVIADELSSMYKSHASYTMSHTIGIDSSSLLVANTGIRGNNDYVWVGTAANNAAKMSSLKKGYTTYISETVYDVLDNYNRLANGDEYDLWTDLGSSDLGYRIYGSSLRSVVP